MSDPTTVENSDRRGFLRKLLATLGACLAGIIPPLAGLGVLLDPLRRKARAAEFVRITTLSSLPTDGVPRKFSVVADRSDAWNRFPNVPIGAVYLRRTGEDVVEAINVVCPHAGCFVDYRRNLGSYYCPCHNSTFDLDGAIKDPKSPSPRGLDPLDTEIRNENEVWVKFQNFQAGQKERIPEA